MGCSILNMLFHLDLSLLEVLFVYTIKKGKKDMFSMFSHIPSFQLVTGLPYSNKGGGKWHVLVRGPWASLIKHSKRDFRPNFSLKIPGMDDPERSFSSLFYWTDVVLMLTFFSLVGTSKDRRDRLVEWVEKALFVHLNKLFEISTNKRNHQTLLYARNLLAVIWGPQPYILPIIPRRFPKVVVPGEYYVLKDLPFHKDVREADTKAHRERLD